MSLPPLPLAPNEHLAGSPEQRSILLAQLTALRTHPRPERMLPGLSFTTLAELLDTRPASLDPDVLHAGYTATIGRYTELGINACLPPSRTWIATESADPAAFHYPGQGYRHLQMATVITRYGPPTAAEAPATIEHGLNLPVAAAVGTTPPTSADNSTDPEALQRR
jgi:hypothetical protein